MAQEMLASSLHVTSPAPNRPKITAHANWPCCPYHWPKNRARWLQQCRCCTRDEPNGFVRDRFVLSFFFLNLTWLFWMLGLKCDSNFKVHDRPHGTERSSPWSNLKASYRPIKASQLRLSGKAPIAVSEWGFTISPKRRSSIYFRGRTKMGSGQSWRQECWVGCWVQLFPIRLIWSKWGCRVWVRMERWGIMLVVYWGRMD